VEPVLSQVFISLWNGLYLHGVSPTYQRQSLGQSTSNLSGVPNQALELALKPAASLVQPSFAKRYLMKAILGCAWAVAVVMGIIMPFGQPSTAGLFSPVYNSWRISIRTSVNQGT
jgi:hypothetical protein